MKELFDFNQIRPEVLDAVVKRAAEEFSSESLEATLGEAMYLERQRIRREARSLLSAALSYRRLRGDQRLWGGIRKALLSRDQLQGGLNDVLWHYAEEVGGHFGRRTYWLATKAVPWSFRWLLNAASVRHFLPWGMTESLSSCLRINGEVDHIRKLRSKGTLLLVPTHMSNIDSVLVGYIIFLMGFSPFAYGAGLNLFSNPALSFFMNRLGAYTVDRKKTNSIYKAILKNYSTEILKRNLHSVFFPGGSRSRSGAIETHLKLGLLGTGLRAQLENLIGRRPNPNIYIVPVTMSYHFVFEAASLIEDYLGQTGRSRFIPVDPDEPLQFLTSLKFFWKLFARQSSIDVRIGRPLDVFGNDVDADGYSIGPNGTQIDPRCWLLSEGNLRPEPQRDAQYTVELGRKIAERFHEQSCILTSHVVAFTLFAAIRHRNPGLDVFRLLRIPPSQRLVSWSDFIDEAERVRGRLLELSVRGKATLAPELKHGGLDWIEDGIRNLGAVHSVDVARRITDSAGLSEWATTDDMNLLYYYRNRLSGYGLVDREEDRSGILV